MMTESDRELRDLVAELDERISRLEDHVAIAQVIAAYGPAVDSGESGVAAALWADDGVYDAGIVVLDSADAVFAMLEGEPHQSFIHAGAAHVVSLPYIRVDGTVADAFCYQQVLLQDESGAFRCWRVSANRWTMQRGPAGWQVARRVNRLLDGSAEAREVLGGGFQDESG